MQRAGPSARAWALWMTSLWTCLGLTWKDPSCAWAADADSILPILSVDPGATCLNREALAVQVEQWLDDARIVRGVTIEVVGSATDPHSARLHVIRDGRTMAHRAFEPGPAQCSHLHAAVGLAIALSLKAELLEDLGEPLAEDPAAQTPGFSLSAAALLTYRVLPRSAPGMELSVARGLGRHFSLRLSAQGTTAFDVELPQSAGSFDTALITGRADACAHGALATRLRGGLCLGAMGGVLRSVGADVPDPTRALVGWVALAQATDLQLMLTPRWSLGAAMSLIVRLNRVEIGVTDATGATAQSLALDRVGLAWSLGPTYHL